MKIHKKYSITFQDYRSGLLLVLENKSSWRIFRAMGFLLVIFSSILIFDNIFVRIGDFPIEVNIAMLIFGIIILEKKILASIVAMIQFRQQRVYLSDIELTISGEKILSTRKGEKAESSWSVYSNIYFNDQVMLLMKSPLLMTIVPRRIFTETEWKWLVGKAGSLISPEHR